MTCSRRSRLPALDGLRGCLALLVVVTHALELTDLRPASLRLGEASVMGFFLLSGCVLVRSWGGAFSTFIVRRMVRLWPTHLVCLILCAAVAGRYPHLQDLTLFPWINDSALANPPTWSLCIEVAAMPLMPAVVWCAARGWLSVGAAAAVCFLAGYILVGHSALLGLLCVTLSLFFIGGGLAGYDIRIPLMERALPQWLGRVSYSLYLCHFCMMLGARDAFGRWGVVAALPLVFPVAWLLWHYVEVPSIAWSRAVGRVPVRALA